MGAVMLLNGSPRAPVSNSKRYAQLYLNYCKNAEYFEITRKNQVELLEKMPEFSDVLLIFPLYADGLPVSLLRFLEFWEENPPGKAPRVSVLINCGFYEPEQNDVAVEMVKLFCRQSGCGFGACLEIGGGEAILDTPFKGLAARGIKKLAREVEKGGGAQLRVKMPITRKMFVNASTGYWTGRGRENGLTREEMDTMKIE